MPPCDGIDKADASHRRTPKAKLAKRYGMRGEQKPQITDGQSTYAESQNNQDAPPEMQPLRSDER